MSYLVERLLPFAKNKVVNIEDITDPALKRMASNPKYTSYIRQGLKNMDSQNELLIPHRVDCQEMQLKRYIQYRLGTTINLTTLRGKYVSYYMKLFKYGSPSEVIRRWGLTPTHEHSRSEPVVLAALREYVEGNGSLKGLIKSDPQLYRSLRYFSSKKGRTIREYLAETGLQK
ncbi:hypothetical protein IAQ67_28650 (plasmid) [Paenibacillus peoriae]|uniref:Uncharacterized protein n=1 Tax=Paenibacillus peoriae TaxID=59893 RepID=A0A7H0YHC4_9BACL|nr:hypothetical protein [Paenibacillus peoriae]QNR70482.1 hypothetical protein IAQ67_28650 [Paenibacillus peoriae]